MGTELSRTIAAIDLGSNSFHMVVGRIAHGELSFLDRMREPVRLAAGLRPDGTIEPKVADRALACLERFGQRLREVPEIEARAVGTYTLRHLQTEGDFLTRAQEFLGVPIEILAGAEEARLIFLGVSHHVGFDPAETSLVIDIGGGSTECVLGTRFDAFATESLHMGCVSYSRRYFPDGQLSRENFESAELAARIELETIEQRFREQGWAHCVGASGTIKAVAEIGKQQGWSESGVEPRTLRKLRAAMIDARTTKKLTLHGLSSERVDVLAGGVAILVALFERLEIETMSISRAALREGILYDLLGRIQHEDVRDRTIGALSERYHVDTAQASRVEATALTFFDQVVGPWNLPEQGRAWLSWASRLHEIGMIVTYSGHHRHGAYLLANSDLPGFSRTEQQLLAALVRGHRRKISQDTFDRLTPFQRDLAPKLCVLLRLAVRLHRGRSARDLSGVALFVVDDGLELTFPEGWLDERPLTRADVDEEVAVLRRAGIGLLVR